MKKHLWKLLLALILLVAVLAVPVAAEEAGSAMLDPAAYDSDFDFQIAIDGTKNYDAILTVFENVNSYRAAAGAAPLQLDSQLTEMAMKRAAEIAVHYGHTRPDNSTCYTIMDGTKFASGTRGENIAVGYVDGDAVSDGWYNSSGHYANMVNTKYKSIGIGCFYQPGGTKCWVQLFSSQSSDNVRTIGGFESVFNLPITVNTANVNIYLNPMGENNTVELYLKQKQQMQASVGNRELMNRGFPRSRAEVKLSNGCYYLTSNNSGVVSASERTLTAVAEGAVTTTLHIGNLTANINAKVFPRPVLTYTLDSEGHPTIKWKDELGNAVLFFKKKEDVTWTRTYANSGSYYHSYGNEGDVYTYVLRVVSEDNDDEYFDVSDPITITIGGEKRTPLKIKTQPKTAYAKLGNKVSTTVTATGDGLTYKWYVSDVGDTKYYPSSLTTKTYSMTMTEAKHNRKAYCVITDKYGDSVRTDTVRLRMAATITTQPKTVSGKLGDTVKTTVKAKGEGLTYTWYFKNEGKTSFSKSSVKTATYSCKVSTSSDDRQIYCVVKDKYGKTHKSDTVTIQEKVKITTQPKTTYTKSGATAKVTVKAKGDGLKYTWYVRNAGSDTYSKSSITSSTYSVKMSSKVKDRRVYCVIKDAYGNKVQTKTVILRMAASVTTQPKSVTVSKGSVAKVTFKAAGDGLKYTWYYKNPGATKFTKTTAFTGTTYKVEMTKARAGRQVYCKITDKYGNTVKTNTVTLKMK